MTRDRDPLVVEALRRNGRAGSAPIHRATRLIDVVDSLGMIVVLLDLEKALGGVPLDVARIGSLVTVGDLLDAVGVGATS